MLEGKHFSVRAEGEPVGGQPNVSDDPSMNGASTMLLQGKIARCEPLPRGSNYVYLLTLERRGQTARAIYKPRRGEWPLWDFPDGTLYLREYAAYLVSQALKWFFIPPTVIREGPHGIGMLQWYITARQTDYEQLFQHHISEFKRIAAFDWLVNNADRKGGHCLEATDGRLWLIDHGLTFNVVPKLRTVIWDFAGQPVPQTVLTDLELLSCQLTASSALMTRLSRLLSPEEIQALKERLIMILNYPVFPSSFGSHRRIPWPPF